MKTSFLPKKYNFIRNTKNKISFKEKYEISFKNTTKLKYFIVPLILMSFVLVGAMCEEKSSRRSKNKDEDEKEEKLKGYLDYKDEKWGFEIKYPDNWEFKKEENQSSVVVSLITPSEGQDDPRENVTLSAYTALENNFDDSIQDFMDNLKSEGIVISKDSKIMISGYPAYKIEYSYIDSTMGKFLFVHYFIDGEDNWYEALYLSLETTYSKYLSKVETIINSIVID